MQLDQGVKKLANSLLAALVASLLFCTVPAVAQSKAEKDAAAMVEAMRRREATEQEKRVQEMERKLHGGGFSTGQIKDSFMMFGLLVMLVTGGFAARAGFRRLTAPRVETEDERLAKTATFDVAPEFDVAQRRIKDGYGEQYLLELAEEGRGHMVDIAKSTIRIGGRSDREAAERDALRAYASITGVSEEVARIYGVGDLAFAIGAAQEFQKQAIDQWFYYCLAEYHLDPDQSRIFLDNAIRIGYEARIKKAKRYEGVSFVSGNRLDVSAEAFAMQKQPAQGIQFMAQALAAAEEAAPMFKRLLDPAKLCKTFDAIASFRNAPVFHICLHQPTRGIGGQVMERIRAQGADFPNLNELIDAAAAEILVAKQRSQERKAARAKAADAGSEGEA